MNILLSKLKFGVKTIPYIKLGQRFLYTYIQTRSDNGVTDYINDALSKEPVTSEGLFNLLKDFSSKFNFNSNNVTKKSIESIWREADKKNIKIDISHFNLIMEIYMRNDIEFDPVEILKDINKRNISFNNITFDILLKKYCKMGDLQSAVKLVDKMLQTNIYLNATKYSWLLGCAIKMKDTESKEKYLEEIKTNNLEIPVLGYYFIAEAYATILDVDSCIESYKQSENVHGKDERQIKSKYHSYYELAKANASDEHLLKFCQFIDETNNSNIHLISTFIRLAKSRLFSAGDFLLKNVTHSLTEDELIHIAKVLIHLQPPFEYAKFLITKINNRRFDKFLIKYLSPFDEAYKIAQNFIKECDTKELKGLSFNLIVNASNSADSMNKFKLILDWLRMTLSQRDYNKCVIGVCISQMLRTVPDQSYSNLISSMESYLHNEANELWFAACCIYHAVCFRDLHQALDLLNRYPLVRDFRFQFSYMDYAHSLLTVQTSIEQLCQSVTFLKSIMTEKCFVALVTSTISSLTFFKRTDDLHGFLNAFPDQLTEAVLTNFKENGKITKEYMEIIENITNQNLRNSQAAR